MYKARKTTAILLSLIMVFSVALNPILTANAGAPAIKPPGANTPTVNTPSIKNPKVLEAPAKVVGTKYQFKDGVKMLPANLSYELKPLTLDRFASFEADVPAAPTAPSGIGANLPNINSPGGVNSPVAAAQDKQGVDLDKINGIKYPPGSQIMVVHQGSAAAFAPQLNEVYADQNQGNAYRILEISGQDKAGNSEYIVATPELTEVFKSYSIPEQTIDLTTGNIAYIAPEFELSPESGMPKNYVAKAGVGDYGDIINYKAEGNKHILTLKTNTLIFEYPSSEQKKEDAKAKEKAKKEKFEGDWWEKEQGSDLRGVENESSLSVQVRVKEGTITIEDPQFHAYFDIDEWTSQVVADFYFDAKATADVTLTGDLVFNKTLEKCVYGYDISLGSVGGNDKGNKAFVGIFLVLGIDGKIHVEVRTITTGDARAGFKFEAIGFGAIPYFVGPYATFEPASFDMSFTVSGEVNVTLACVPQVGVIIWGKELGVLQIWVGFKTKATFEASGGGGSSGSQGFKASGTIDLKAFGELVGYLLGSRYSIFYIDFPLYHGEWTVGEEVSGSGGDAVREVSPYIRLKADAYKDSIEGIILFDTAGNSGNDNKETEYSGENADIESTKTPYANAPFTVEVWDWSDHSNIHLEYTIPAITDAEGKIFIRNTQQFNIRPQYNVQVKITDSPEFNIDNNKYKVVGNSKPVIATVPFSELSLNADSFNDVISGCVSGKYNGPVKINIQKNAVGANNDVITANAVNGVFTVEYPINETTGTMFGYIDFEGTRYSGKLAYRNLDALTLNIFNDFTPPEVQAQTNGTQSSGTFTVPNAASRVISAPNSVTSASDKLSELASKDSSGRKFIKPTRVIGTISNKGEMGWIQSQGEDYVIPGSSSRTLRYFDGEVKITAISVQSALQELMERSGSPWIPKPRPSTPPYTATVRAQQVLKLKPVPDSSPMGVRIEQVPTSSARFEFNQPDVLAYIVEIEHEGLTLKQVYNPYVQHGSSEPSLADIIGPLKEAVTLVTQEHIDSVINPADVTNQWNASWQTQIGIMQLTQKGNSVTGSIMQGGAALPVQGTVSNGVFTGTCMVPVAKSSNTAVSIQMSISADGKSISFGNIGTNARLRGLSGTRASRQ